MSFEIFAEILCWDTLNISVASVCKFRVCTETDCLVQVTLQNLSFFHEVYLFCYWEFDYETSILVDNS